MDKQDLNLRWILVAFLILASCTRPQEEAASVSIHIPSAQEFMASGKMQSLSGTPVDYNRLCFAVNVTGPGIVSQPSNTCDVQRGIISEAVKPGSSLVLTIPGGTDRAFEVFGFLRDSTSQDCPALPQNGWGGWTPAKVYSLGKKSSVEINPPEATVGITISLPDVSQNILAQNNWPSSCQGGVAVADSNTGRISLASTVLTGATYKMSARVGLKSEGTQLQGSQFKMKSWINSP